MTIKETDGYDMKNSVFFMLVLSFLLILSACGTRSSSTPQDESGDPAQNNRTDISDISKQAPGEESLPDKLTVEDTVWDEITADGVNEELLLENTDKELLVQIAAELQALVDEELEEERKDPEIVISEGWARVFESERYKKVLNIGNPAMKPLYLILYKSPNAGMYEYICARTLYELSGFDFYWTNSRDFIVGFNEKIIESRR